MTDGRAKLRTKLVHFCASRGFLCRGRRRGKMMNESSPQQKMRSFTHHDNAYPDVHIARYEREGEVTTLALLPEDILMKMALQIPSIVYCLLALLLALTTAQDVPLMYFNGRVVNDLGEPMEGAQVQFWHTDPNGNYNHPSFRTSGVALLPDFQYFGTATTATDGTFQFKTYRPGLYAARPISHIHFKVWFEGNDILTSQLYFIDENTTQPPSLQLALLPQADGSVVTNTTIVVDMGLGGSEPITPSQTAGPFYPVVDFFGYDSDMTVVTPLEASGTVGETPTEAPENSPSQTDPAQPSDAGNEADALPGGVETMSASCASNLTLDTLRRVTALLAGACAAAFLAASY